MPMTTQCRRSSPTRGVCRGSSRGPLRSTRQVRGSIPDGSALLLSSEHGSACPSEVARNSGLGGSCRIPGRVRGSLPPGDAARKRLPWRQEGCSCARHDKPNVWPMAYERPAMSVERLLACGHRRRVTEQLLIVPTEGALSGHSPSCQALAEQPARRSPLTRASRRGQTKRRRTSWTSSTHPRRFPTTDTGSVSAWTRAGPATAATSRIRCSTAGVTSMQ